MKMTKTKALWIAKIALFLILVISSIARTHTINNLKSTVNEKNKLIIQQDSQIQILQDEKNQYIKYWQDCQEYRKLDSLLYRYAEHPRWDMP
jgi:hypothetical protein